MASHHLTAAKASFVAASLRADVTKIGRNDIDHFHSLLEACLLQCSPSNIQKCKLWLSDHILPSLHRTTALGRYLTSVCKHISSITPTSETKKVHTSRQQLHALYVINDVLHHARYHVQKPTLRVNLEQGLSSAVTDIFSVIASSCKERVKSRLQDLLKIWVEHSYFATSTLQDIGRAFINDPSSETRHNPQPQRARRELPYVMPASHGDPSVPFYDLPAANLMPHIVPNAPVSMNAEQIRPLRLSSGPPDEYLIRAVKDFLQEVDRLDDPYNSLEVEGVAADIDELGQLTYRTPDDEVVGETYYGWSRNFCEKMKSRGHSGRTPSPSRSPSSIRKRRRRNSSRSWSDSGSSPRRARSRSFSPTADKPHLRRGESPSQMTRPGDLQQQGSVGRQQPFGFHPPPLGPNNTPIPPPKPPSWNGPWPPLLMPPAATGVGSAGIPFGVPPPPPPPP